ncbi:MAG TPA: hypothetical protein VFG86_08030, partial [Chloroflexota bacterium]|nr:hypothetical protein [Chloroflexota bacterium]
LSQYLRLVGKEQDAFESEMREQAETRIRRSLILDAFADAEHIEAPADREDGDQSREQLALARLVELATADGKADPASRAPSAESTPEEAKSGEMETQAIQTFDTEGHAPEEERGTAS